MSPSPREFRGRPLPRPIACHYCKAKKIRCDGETPCSNCNARRQDCDYPPIRERRKRRSSGQSSRALEERLSQLEELLKMSQRLKGQTPLYIGEPYRAPSQAAENAESPVVIEGDIDWMLDLQTQTFLTNPVVPQYGNQEVFRLGETLREGPELEFDPNQTIFLSSSSQLDRSSPGMNQQYKIANPSKDPLTAARTSPGAAFSPSRIPTCNRRSSIMVPTQMDEPYRPGSLLSICSSPGIAWVTERTGASDFGESARLLGTTVRRGLKKSSGFDRTPEPDEETAWRFCKAYFEETLETVMGIVHRANFEARLREHISHPERSEDDAGFYALRNAVYASGCRAEYSKAIYKMSFEEAQRRGWGFFENALSVQTDLLYGETDISAVQALVAMVFFTEGLGNPTLEYVLCCNALLLAQAKGLHRLDPDEPRTAERSWLFWAIYCYATHLACLSGRAPVIDDDIITCPLPTVAMEGTTINIEIFSHIVNVCRISSTTFRKLAAIKTLSQTPDEVISIVRELHLRLQQWRDTLPLSIRPDFPINPSTLPDGYHRYHVMFLQFSYYGSLMAIHSIFAYPWNVPAIDSIPDSLVSNQIAISKEIVINAARNIILATKYIDIDASLPGWLLVYYPLVSCMNVFIHVLSDPTHLSVQADLNLMEMVVGHFGHLSFISSETAFSFPRQMVNIASVVVKRAQEKVSASLSLDDYIVDPTFFGDIDFPISNALGGVAHTMI